MKLKIYYFSGTGNCLKVARDIASKFDGAELISIPDVINSSEIPIDAEAMGIVYPVYMFGMPLIVSEFIKKIKIPGDVYIFAVATYGGMCGASLVHTHQALKQKGLKLSAGFAVKMPGNYTPLYEAISQEKQYGMFEKEKNKINNIGSIVKQKKESRIEKSFFLINCIFSGLVYKLGIKNIKSMDKSFWVDEKCNSCAICQKVCPVYNIKMEQGKPKWLHNCQQCMACLQWCPQEAIQFGKNTPGRKRYQNPDVTVNDFIR